MKATTHDRFVVAAIILIGLILLALPAHAQDTAEPPVTGTASSTLYLHPWSCDANQLYLPAVSR